MHSNEMVVASRIKYEDYKALHEIRLSRADLGKRPSISELIREAIINYIGEHNDRPETH